MCDLIGHLVFWAIRVTIIALVLITIAIVFPFDLIFGQGLVRGKDA